MELERFFRDTLCWGVGCRCWQPLREDLWREYAPLIRGLFARGVIGGFRPTRVGWEVRVPSDTRAFLNDPQVQCWRERGK